MIYNTYEKDIKICRSTKILQHVVMIKIHLMRISIISEFKVKLNLSHYILFSTN